MAIKVFLQSLGCSKNQVSAEQMLYILSSGGVEIVLSPENADVVLVNTCGFIDSAKEEAIDCILLYGEMKKQNVIKALVVSGCLAQRYGDEFLNELPEVDAILGTGSFDDILEAVTAAYNGQRGSVFMREKGCASIDGERILLTPPYYAYLRIAEGCDNRCAYCVIPDIRGPFRSRQLQSIISEAAVLAKNGVKELILVSQDTSRYGRDIYNALYLAQLIRRLCEIEELQWIRLHYLYPDELPDELFEEIARQPKVVKYFDLPLQHIDDDILRSMNRRGDSGLIKQRINKIRQMMPESVIRTSLIVGFPGETEEQFNRLYDFLAEYKLERVGVFAYSREEGSKAYDMDNQIPAEVAENRRQRIYMLQEDIMHRHSSSFVGKTLKVLCCGFSDAYKKNWGRSYMDSPEIDGGVFFDGAACEGSFVNVMITSAQGCDLFGFAT